MPLPPMLKKSVFKKKVKASDSKPERKLLKTTLAKKPYFRMAARKHQSQYDPEFLLIKLRVASSGGELVIR